MASFRGAFGTLMAILMVFGAFASPLVVYDEPARVNEDLQEPQGVNGQFEGSQRVDEDLQEAQRLTEDLLEQEGVNDHLSEQGVNDHLSEQGVNGQLSEPSTVNQQLSPALKQDEQQVLSQIPAPLAPESTLLPADATCNRNELAEFSALIMSGLKEYTVAEDKSKTIMLGFGVEEWLNLADKYHLEGLRTVAEKTIGGSLDVENALETFRLSGVASSSTLRSSALTFIKSNLKEISESKAMQEYAKASPEGVGELFGLLVNSNVCVVP